MAAEEKTKALLQCNKCGFCLAHCPVYKVTGLEWTAARGRIALIRGALLDNQLEIGDIKAAVSNCLTCKACVDDCPAAVPTADIILSTREEILRQHGDSWMRNLIFRRLLASPSLLHKASRLLRVADMTGLRTFARKTGLLQLMGDAGRASVMVPGVPSGRLDDITRLAQKIEHPKYRVAYFVGCHAANLGPDQAAATMRILHRHQVEVTVPEFVCCGLPASGYGEIASARNLARRNIDIAGKLHVDAIITSCASCSSFLKDYARLLADEPQLAESAKTFSGKVKDLSEFLVDIGLVTGMGNIGKKVTYHDPCHLARYQKIKNQPRTILKNIPGVEFIELPEADMCCGAAGTYGFKNYDLSMRVLARKMENVAKTGAEILVSACPACIMQLASGARERKMPVETLSLVQLLDRAYRLTKEE